MTYHIWLVDTDFTFIINLIFTWHTNLMMLKFYQEFMLIRILTSHLTEMRFGIIQEYDFKLSLNGSVRNEKPDNTNEVKFSTLMMQHLRVNVPP